MAGTIARWNALVASGEDSELDLFSRAKGTWASPTQVEPRPVLTPAQCATCHAVDRLVASPRTGYWHFERVHRIVSERSMACVQCHAEMSPYRPTAHRIDRVAQIDSCGHCHLPPGQ